MAEEEDAGNLAEMRQSIELINGSMDYRRYLYNITNSDCEGYINGQERYA